MNFGSRADTFVSARGKTLRLLGAVWTFGVGSHFACSGCQSLAPRNFGRVMASLSLQEQHVSLCARLSLEYLRIRRNGAETLSPTSACLQQHLTDKFVAWVQVRLIRFMSNTSTTCAERRQTPLASLLPSSARARPQPWMRHVVSGAPNVLPAFHDAGTGSQETPRNTKKHQETPRNTKKHTKTFIMPPFNGRCLVCLTDLDCNDLKKSELYEWYELV